MSKLGISNLGGLANPSFKNKIINGDFNIWQRGTSFVSPSTIITTDRFKYGRSGAMRHTISRDTDVPTLSESEHKSNYSIKIDCTIIDAAIAAAEYCVFSYDIEGYDYASLAEKTATLSFWVKATKTGTYCVSFRNNGLDRSYVIEYTVNSSDVWEKKEHSLTFDQTGGTENYTNARGIRLDWILASGSNFQTTANTWQSGIYISTSNQVNACDNIANNFWLSQVQFEVGSFATPFENRPVETELKMCQRYYEKSYDVDIDPGTVTNTGMKINFTSSVIREVYVLIDFFKVYKRTTPTITWYSPTTGNTAKMYRWTGGGGEIAITNTLGQAHSKTGFPQVAVGPADQSLIGVHWAADAEL